LNHTAIFIITYLCDILLFAVALIGVLRYKRLEPAFKVLATAAVASLSLNIIENIYIAVYKSNAPIYHIRAIVEYIFYALTYYYLFTNRRLKTIILVSIAVLTPFSIINALYLQPYHNTFPTYVNVPTLALLVIFALMLFKQMLLSPLKTPLMKQGTFWFNTGIIFYSTTMFLVIGLSNVYKSDLSLYIVVFYLWYSIVYIFAILVGIALFTDNRKIDNNHAV